MAAVTFQKASKKKAKLRLGLTGPSGSGKTMTALIFAEVLAEGKGVAVIDTERGSASLYADQFDFSVLELDSYHPDRFVEAIKAAEAAGFGCLVIDSFSHAWSGKDGVLDQVDAAAQRQRGTNKNTFIAWKEGTPLHNKLIEAILSSKMHVICTMRAKTEHVMDKDRDGSTVIRKVGLQPIQRDQIEFEFTMMGDLNQDNTLVFTKSRFAAMYNAVIQKPTAEVARRILDWLSDGGDATETAVVLGKPQPPGKSLAEQLQARGIPVNETTLADAAAGWFDPETSLHDYYQHQIGNAKTLAELDTVSKNMAKEVPKDHPDYPALVAAGKQRKSVLLDQKAAKES
jgi:energy-coupling factor transporter ATP-binding protein EcfA2